MFDGVKSVAQAAATLTALVEQIDPAQIAALCGSLVQWAERIEAAVGRIERDVIDVRAKLIEPRTVLAPAPGAGGAADAAGDVSRYPVAGIAASL